MFKVIHCRIVHQILATMDNDWQECVGIDRHLHVMTIKANLSHFYSDAMLSFYAVAGIIYLLGEHAIRFVNLVGGYNDTSRQLPMKIQLPFETEHSPTFELLTVILSLHIMLEICTISIINALICTVVSFIFYICKLQIILIIFAQLKFILDASSERTNRYYMSRFQNCQ